MHRQKRNIPYLQGVCILEHVHIRVRHYGHLNTCLYLIQFLKMADGYNATGPLLWRNVQNLCIGYKDLILQFYILRVLPEVVSILIHARETICPTATLALFSLIKFLTNIAGIILDVTLLFHIIPLSAKQKSDSKFTFIKASQKGYWYINMSLNLLVIPPSGD